MSKIEAHGKKNFGFPSVLYSKWKKLLSEHEPLLLKHSETPLVKLAIGLINSEELSWEKQNVYLKELGKE